MNPSAGQSMNLARPMPEGQDSALEPLTQKDFLFYFSQLTKRELKRGNPVLIELLLNRITKGDAFRNMTYERYTINRDNLRVQIAMFLHATKTSGPQAGFGETDGKGEGDMDHQEIEKVEERTRKALLRGVFSVDDALKTCCNEYLANGFSLVDSLKMFISNVVTPVISALTGHNG